ncbi:MAG: hypothetical protein MH252_12150 [Thermosynechococcaceae cyanobacterium MS004]|nr:hypothetical protein [Thermosynechococcaceae cyanobacterium MS004]
MSDSTSCIFMNLNHSSNYSIRSTRAIALQHNGAIASGNYSATGREI